jgi:protein TonB
MKTMNYEHIFNEEIKPQSFGWQRLGAIPMGVVMTLVLLFAMRELVSTEFTEVDIEPAIPIPDVSMNIPKFIEVREELPDRPEIIEQPPKLEFEEPVIAKIDPGAINIQPVDTKIVITRGQDIGFSGQPMPIVRINPNYPTSAASRNIEGYVDVVFDITPIGTTTNVRITGFSPSTVFNSSVLKAVRRWKYKPAADEAGTQATLDVKERITFVLEK